MARHAQDREDLLHDATALVPRLMLQMEVENAVVEVFAGFRRGNALSLYFDADPVFHFNSGGQLRRAFVDDRILKADHGQLVAWEPERTSERVMMVRRELSMTDQVQLKKSLVRKLTEVKFAIAETQFTLIGQFPVDGDGLERLSSWLESIPDFSVAASPNVS